MKETIALIAATEVECSGILRRLKRTNTSRRGHFVINTGVLEGKKVVVVVGGPGKANASSATVLAILQYDVRKVINLGVGGAFSSSGLRVGELALCTEDIYAEEGTITKRGFKDLRSIGLELIPQRAVYNRIAFSAPLLKKAEFALKRASMAFEKGRFITVSTVTGSTDRAEELTRRFKPICESMEGAAVGQMAISFGIPALQIRGISNIVEDRNRRRWKIREAAAVCQDAVVEIVKAL